MPDYNELVKNLEENINMSKDVPEETKIKMMKAIHKIKDRKINILITGATGCGKSSTINALFGEEKAKVGCGVDPETMDITKYELDNLTLWDSPGLGDGKEADNRHSKNIINKLMEKDSDGNALIDIILVILDGSSRDLGTSYELINQVIIPNLGENNKKRLLIGINQCDIAMKGRHFDREKNCPDEELTRFLEEKCESVKRRIREATGVDVDPVYYCAGYTDGEEKQRPYNLSKLLYYIVTHTPAEKRLVYVSNISDDTEMWKDNDEVMDYGKSLRNSFVEALSAGFDEFKDSIYNSQMSGASLGYDIAGGFGEFIGSAVGTVFGAVGGAVRGIGSFIGSLFDF